MSLSVYRSKANPKIMLVVRPAMGPGLYIVGRWDREQLKWAKPIKFSPIAAYPSRDECQNALDAYARMRGLKLVSNTVRRDE